MIRLSFLLILVLVSGCAHTPDKEAALPPQEVESRLDLAEMYLVEAEPRMALEQLKMVQGEAADDPMLYFFLGVAYELLSDHEKSVQAYEQAVALDPDFGDAWNNLGQVRQVVGEFEKARQAFKRALGLEDYMTPEFAAYNMADLLAEQGEYDQALVYSTLGLEKNRRYIPLYPQKAFLLRKTGRHEQALDVLRLGVDARPDSSYLKLMLAEELVRHGLEREAKSLFARLIEQDPESDEAEKAVHYLEVLR